LLLLEAELVSMQNEQLDRATVGGELLVELLQDKRELATGRIFKLLGLLHREEDFRVIHSGLESLDATDRASAEELVETLLSREVANAVRGLTMTGSAEKMLAVADPTRKVQRTDYASTVQMLLKDESRSVAVVALYHAGEIGIDCDLKDFPSADSDRDDVSRRTDPGLQDRALAILRELSEQGARRSRPVVQALWVR
jgi:hypothetical protein